MTPEIAQTLINLNTKNSEKLAELSRRLHEATTEEQRKAIYQMIEDVNAQHEYDRAVALGRILE